MFSNLSLSSISLATVTPSLVVLGAPNDLSITTFLPLGPNVTFTALAKYQYLLAYALLNLMKILLLLQTFFFPFI